MKDSHWLASLWRGFPCKIENDESEADVDTFHREDTQKGLFQEDVTTALPYLENVVYVPGCTAIYMK